MKHPEIPDWKLERYVLGELPKSEFDAIRARLPDDPHLRERIEALRRSDAELLEKYPPAWMARQMQQPELKRPANKMIGMSRWMAPALLFGAALVMTPMLFVANTDTVAPNGQVAWNDTRIKGMEARLEVWRKTGDSAEKLAPRSTAQAGDQIQLRYTVPERCYGALVSVDGRGVVTLHMAGEGGAARLLEPGKTITLGNAYQLDDAPRFETFFLITSPHEFDLAKTTQALATRQNEQPPSVKDLPAGLGAVSFTLSKQP